ncbi:hypothetical protein QBC39DRAFT_39372 [Podospora conica]|nr:hypothetical protein QBC39DRAFT_39372 [Schizothecium conicum]
MVNGLARTTFFHTCSPSAMTPSPTPPPSTVGLLRGDLRTSWPAWREPGAPQVFVGRHTTVPPSFEDANDLTRVGLTPAPAKQLSENKIDPLEAILTARGVLDDSPQLPSRPTKHRTKSGLCTQKNRPRDTRNAVDDGEARTLQADPVEKPSSHNLGIHAMSSKRVVVTAKSAVLESVAKGSRMENRAPGGTTIVNQVAPPAPSKNKKRKSPQDLDIGSVHRPHKKQRGKINTSAENDDDFDATNSLASPQTEAPSKLPPSGQPPVEDLSTEKRPAQADTQFRQPGFTEARFIEEPETMDMDQGFDFESPGKFLAQPSQRATGAWARSPNPQAQKLAAEPPARCQPKSVNFDVPKAQTGDVESIPRGNTGSATVEAKVIDLRTSSSPMFVSQRSAASPLRHKQSKSSLTTSQETPDTELSTSNTTTGNSSRISETPPPRAGQRMPALPRSPRKMGNRHSELPPHKKHIPFLSSEPFVEGTCTQPAGFSDPKPVGPEDQWRKATEEESLPAILHNIVTSLHRVLKSKEDAVTDVAREYRENVLQLLDAMVSRHASDRIESCDAHEVAARGLLRSFTVAEANMKGLVDSIKALDVHQAKASVKHPAFVEKLDRVCNLYEAKLGKYAKDRTGEQMADGESEEAEEPKGKKCDQAMVDEYCALLRHKTQPNDDATSSIRKVHAEADRLLYGLPPDEGQDQGPAPVKEPVKKLDDVRFQAWDVELDVILDTEFKMDREKNDDTAARDDGDAAVPGVVSELRDGDGSDDSYRE